MDEKWFSLRLAKLRQQKGISARDMSLSMGQNPGYINNIEMGKSMPSLTGIIYICDYLGVSVSDFFSEADNNPVKVSQIVQNLKKLNAEQLDAVDAVVKAFAEDNAGSR